MTTEPFIEVSRSSQTRNIAVYAISVWLQFLAAPVLYVGITQTALCHGLGASDTVANLPSSAYFWMLAVPIVIVWRFRTVGAIKPVLVASFMMCALAGLIVAAILTVSGSLEIKIAAAVLYGAIAGGANATIDVFSWDVIKRGVETSRRGLAFSMAYGVGPVFAVVGSLGAQWILTGRIDSPWASPAESAVVGIPLQSAWAFPLNFAVLFGASVPIMLAAALLTTCLVLPTKDRAPQPQAFLHNILNGFREVAGDRVLLTAVLAYLAISCGSTIVGNMSLFTAEALDRPPEDYAGMQNALRFGFKIFAGLFLGWLVVRTHARMGMLATGGLTLLGIMWVLFMPRQLFLITFGIMGAGELWGVYYPNYVVARSRPEQVRLNLAIIGLLSLLISAAPMLFGAISDHFGLPASFAAAGGVVGVSLALVLFLPSNPQPTPPQPNDPSPQPTAFQPIK